MKLCRNCGAQMEDGAAFCTKCGARQETPDQPSAQGQVVRFESKNMTGTIIGFAAQLVIAWVIWSMVDTLPDLFYAREKMMFLFLILLFVAYDAVMFARAVSLKKQVYLQLEQEGVSGVWIKYSIINKPEAFRFSYREIEDVKALSMIGISLKIRGRWRNISIDQSVEAKQLIDQRRAVAR